MAWLDQLIEEGGKGNSIGHRYSAGDFRGYSGTFNSKLLPRIRGSPDVAFVERDQYVSIYRTLKASDNKILMKQGRFSRQATDGPMFNTQDGATWGLTRVSQKESASSVGKYSYPESAGKGVTAYVIDTGIMISHEEFGGRARWGKTLCANEPDVDYHGHGTHVAGTIGGTQYGICKERQPCRC